MSDEPQGPDWWRAADGKWYRAEQHPDYRPPPPPASPSSVAPPPPAPPAAYSAIHPTGSAQTTQSGYNKLAIGSLIAGFLGCLCIGSPVAIALGFMSLRQIQDSGGAQQGKPMAITGIVLGCGFLAYFVGIMLWSMIASSPSSY